MNGIILAAGRGSRLRPFTDNRPKCLVEVAGIPLLERQVNALRAAGAKSVAVVVGWCGDQIANRGYKTILNPRWADTTMVESLLCARDWLRHNVTLVSYADIIYSHNTAKQLAQSDEPLVITYDPEWRRLWSRRFEDPLVDAETFSIDSHGTVLDIGRRPSSYEEIQGQYMGLLKFKPTAWREVERILAYRSELEPGLDVTGLLRQVISEGRIPVRAIPSTGAWCEIDRPLDIDIATPIAQELDREFDESLGSRR